jgi:3-oxoacyl-[acyl-carrier protein] reductase
MRLDFKGQVVLITGATRGIGRQLAADFSKLGARLLLTGTNEEQIKSLQSRAGYSKDPKIRYFCVDFTNAKSTRMFLKELGEFKKVDVCVNNAGINRVNLLDESREEDWDDILTVNLKAPFMVMRAVSKVMKRNRYGRIVNIASIFGLISREKRVIYSASKFGLRGLTVSASNELARHNVLVNAVSPGFVRTDLTARMLSDREIAELTEQIPIRRLATPGEISNVVLFLASSFNTYTTGQNIVVDGGYVNV